MSNNVKGKVLTVELVQTKTKSDNLHNIKNLNLWGNQLQDLQIIEKMPNLEVISLSVNKISSLKDFAKCSKLQELYLRKNCIVDLRQIKYLLDLPQLKSLWLYDNPCAQQDNYRQIVLHHLPNLTKLDNNVVTPQEKQAALNSKYALDFSSFSRERQSSVAESAKKIQPNQSEVRKQRPYSEILREDKPERQSIEPGHRNIANKQGGHHDKQNLSRNKNILIAILSLIKQLDSASLQIVMRQAQTQLKSH